MNKASGGNLYKNINAQTGVVDADPHRLIQMLFTGSLEQISIAKGCISRQDLAGKGEAISKAIGIVGGLNDSINHDVANDGLSTNLSSLYDFITQRLAQANLNNDTAGLDEAADVLKELQAGWNEIRPEAMAQLKTTETATV